MEMVFTGSLQKYPSIFQRDSIGIGLGHAFNEDRAFVIQALNPAAGSNEILFRKIVQVEIGKFFSRRLHFPIIF
jgi:hypothetical protein